MGICPSRHFAVKYGGELLYRQILFVSVPDKQILCVCIAFFA